MERLAEASHWRPSAGAGGWHRDCRPYFRRPLNAALIAEMEQALATALEGLVRNNYQPEDDVRRAIDLTRALDHAREVLASSSSLDEEEEQDMMIIDYDDGEPAAKRARSTA